MKARHIILGSISAVLLAIGGAASTASASPIHSGTEHFLLVQTDENGQPVIIATGPIHALGTDVQVTNNRDRFVFPAGVVIIKHHATSSGNSYDPKTCTGRFTESGWFKVLGGTGKYWDATGSGTYSLHGLFVGCNQNQPPKAFELTIRATGPISF